MTWPGYEEHLTETEEPTAAEYREVLELCVEPLSAALSHFSHEVDSWGERYFQHYLLAERDDIATTLAAVKALLARGEHHAR